MVHLMPKTHAWAGLEAARETARRADEQARRSLAIPDDVRTIFFLGFEIDERLAERLADLTGWVSGNIAGGRARAHDRPVSLTRTRVQCHSCYLSAFFWSAMPHLGHFPGADCFTSGCMGHV